MGRLPISHVAWRAWYVSGYWLLALGAASGGWGRALLGVWYWPCARGPIVSVCLLSGATLRGLCGPGTPTSSLPIWTSVVWRRPRPAFPSRAVRPAITIAIRDYSLPP